MKRRREITLETEKIVIRGDLREVNWCQACTASTPMVTAEQAAILIGEETEQLYRRVEAGQVHSTRTPSGVLMICLKSLSGLPGSEWRTTQNRSSLTADKKAANEFPNPNGVAAKPFSIHGPHCLESSRHLPAFRDATTPLGLRG